VHFSSNFWSKSWSNRATPQRVALERDVAAPVRPPASRAVPSPWRPGRAPAEAACLPKASRAPGLPLKSAPPRGASAFADRTLGHDHRSVRRSPSTVRARLPRRAPYGELTQALPRRRDRRGAAPAIKRCRPCSSRRAPLSSMDSISASSSLQADRHQTMHASLATTP
jgi:hypothetical protein